MASYMIDEKKNLVTVQGGSGGLVKENYDFTFSSEATTESQYINGTFNSDTDNLLTKILSDNFVMATVTFNIDGHSWQRISVDPIIGGSFLVGDIYMTYLPFRFLLQLVDATNLQLSFVRIYESSIYPSSLYGSAFNVLKSSTGTLTLYLRS